MARKGKAALRHLRRLCAMPAPEAAWWASLTRAERMMLLRLAGLDESLWGSAWPALIPFQRQRILHAAQRAAAWAQRLCDRQQGPGSGEETC